MTRKVGRRVLVLLGAILVMVATALYVYRAFGPQPIQLPAPDLSQAETAVRATIEDARRAVLEQLGDAGNWAKLGYVYHIHNWLDAAAECYSMARALSPGDYRWPYLAALATRKDDPARAVEDFEASVALNPGAHAVRINFGDTLLELGLYERAAEQFAAALEKHNGSVPAHYGLARVMLSQDDLQGALTHLETAVGLGMGHREVHHLLSQVYLRVGNNEGAKREELRALASPEARRLPDPVYEEVDKAGVSSNVLARRGLNLAAVGRFREAEIFFRRVLQIRSGVAEDYANLGAALASQGKREEAAAQYRRALEVDPLEPAAHNNLAVELINQGETDAAIGHLRQALEIEPHYADAEANLGRVYIKLENPVEAEKHFRAALDHQPELLRVRSELAAILAQQGKTEAAIHEWGFVLDVRPDDLEAHHELGLALARLGRHEEAIAHFRDGLRLAPNSSRYHLALAWELATSPEDSLRNGAEAVRLAQRVVIAYPNQVEALDILAAAFAETGTAEQAIGFAQRAASLAEAAGRHHLSAEIRLRLEGYRRKEAYRQAAAD